MEADISLWHTRLKRAERRLQPIHNRFDEDEKLVEEDFQIPATEGEWDSFTANDLSVLTETAVNVIANGEPYVFVAGHYRSKKENREVSESEQFVDGLLAVNDQSLTAVPEELTLQHTLAVNSVKGGVSVRAVIYVDDEGNVVPDAVCCSIRDSYWESIGSGLAWWGRRKRTTVEDIKEQYGKELTGSENGEVDILELWDDTDNGILELAFDNPELNPTDWIKEPEAHNVTLNGKPHLPVKIIPSGANFKSLIHNDRKIIPLKSRVGSYILTLIGKAAKTPLTGEFDGSMSGGAHPEIEGDPNARGAVLWLDSSKGQEITPADQPQIPQYAFSFYDRLQSDIAIGGLSAIARGIAQGTPAGVTVQGLREAAEKIVYPYMKTVQEAISWICEEFVGQFNDLDEKYTVHIEGLRKGTPYTLDKKPGEINSKFKFRCIIKPDILLDRQANVAMANALRQPGGITGEPLVSDDTAREISGVVQDPDAEKDKILREKAYTFAYIEEQMMADALAKHGDKENARRVMDEIDQRRRLEVQEKMKMSPPPQTPQMPSTAQMGTLEDQPNRLQRALGRLRQRMMG